MIEDCVVVEVDSDFYYYQDDGMYIESDGDVYDVDTYYDGTTYNYWTDWDYGVIMKLSQLSNGPGQGTTMSMKPICPVPIYSVLQVDSLL